MKPFLKSAADDLKHRFADLSRVAVVFPNLRARLFFNHYLVGNDANSIWCPQYLDIDSLFQSGSKLNPADNLMLNSLLYKVYSQHFTSNNHNVEIEGFDEFFYFGQIILSDFNEVDKYMVDARQLYGNISDLDKLNDNFSHLDDKQKDTISRFFADTKSDLKQNFFSVWNILADVYDDFRNLLKTKELAYQGMIYREAVENFDESAYNAESYVFIGFNVLTECEKELLKKLKHKSLFYWDYDNFYLSENQYFEAGKFMRENIKNFPVPQGFDFEKDNLIQPKNITFAAAPSEILQTAYIPHWIKDLDNINYLQPNTAIVLCNENLLLPAVDFLPPDIEFLNITMGYPITQTPVYDYIIRLLELYQKGIKNGKFYYSYLISVLNHHYTLLIDKELADLPQKIEKEKLFYLAKEELNCETLFTSIETPLQMVKYFGGVVATLGTALKTEQGNFASQNLYNEAVFRIFQIFNRLSDLLECGFLDVKLNTFISLIKRILANESVPFHGEPAKGLQIMGMLETRNLDFENLLLLSVNEGVMPKLNFDMSFIPQFIRKHFKMSGIEHQDAIFSYYFYRLLQRAKNITLLYNNANNSVSKNEMSRFLLQLLLETPFEIKTIALTPEMQPIKPQNIIIEKTPELLKKLHSLFNYNENKTTLTPTLLNSYLDCHLQFYLKYVAGFKTNEQLTDELDESILGRLIHRTIEYIYCQIGKTETANFKPFKVYSEQIDFYIENQQVIANLIEKAFIKEFFQHSTLKSEYNGEQLIYFNVAQRFVNKLLEFDKQNAPFDVLEMESFRHIEIDLSYGLQISVGGRIDRVIGKDGNLFVDDFKTTSRTQTVKDIDDIFIQNRYRSKYITQSFVYSLVMSKLYTDRKIVPRLLYIPKLHLDEGFVISIGKDEIKDFEPYSASFQEILTDKIAEIFNPFIPFSPTTIDDTCKYCDFNNICHRGQSV